MAKPILSTDPCCADCPLYSTGQLCPSMPISGENRLGITFVGEAQGYQEAQAGVQFVGEAGQTLRSALASLGYDLDLDFSRDNSVRCRPPKNRKPTHKEIKCCRPKIFEDLHRARPKMVIALGTSALVSLIGEYIKNIKITRFRDTIIPIPEHNFYLASTVHPSFVNRQKAPDDDYAYDTLKRDLKAALNYAHTLPDNHQVETLDLKKPLRLVTDFLTFSALMEKLDREKPITAFDFETSSLKPQGPQRRIWSMSICFDGVSYSFPVHYPKIQGKFPQYPEDTFWGVKYLPLIHKKIQRYLQDPKIFKIAHNESFERIWSYFVFKTLVANLGWCSMVNQHILDSRTAFCGLKFQAFVRWGVHGYDDEANKYMSSAGHNDTSGGNSLNQLHNMPLESLLSYGGIDSFLTEKLAYEEKEVFKFGNNKLLNRARKLFHDTGIAFTDCQKTGVRIDVDYYTDKSHDLAGEIQFIRDKIYKSAPVKKFEVQEKRPFKLTSPKDLRILLFNVLNEIPAKQTDTGLDSVDKSVLADLKTPLAKQVVKIRELIKLKDTYIAQYLREEVDGIMYPFLHTHTARSGRSSSSGPNLQNVPIRDEKAKKLIRSGIFPFLGHKLAEIDFKGIEINVLGCETKDRALLKYLWNPKSDMHYDQAKKLFLLSDDQMNKDLRYNAKSDFVFLEVYGGEAAASAKYLWHDSVDIRLGPNSDGPKLLNHFFDQGIRNLDDYIEHVKDVERQLWKRFPGIRTWQKKQCQFYLDNGYVETHFGFRRSGYLSQNAILNTQTQSTAAHLLWWCFKRLNEIRKEEKWESKLLGQIHDSKLPSIYPDEEEHVMKTICRVMTIDAPRTFKWVIVPIDIEIEMGGIDQSWYDIKEVSEEYYKSLRDEGEVAKLTDELKARVRAL